MDNVYHVFIKDDSWLMPRYSYWSTFTDKAQLENNLKQHPAKYLIIYGQKVEFKVTIQEVTQDGQSTAEGE